MPRSTDSPTLYGFALDTGRPLWSLTLDGRSAANQYPALLEWVEVESGRVIVFRSDRGDLINVNPSDGAFAWRVTVGDVFVTGTQFAADGTLAINLSNSILIDPESGARTSAAPD